MTLISCWVCTKSPMESFVLAAGCGRDFFRNSRPNCFRQPRFGSRPLRNPCTFRSSADGLSHLSCIGSFGHDPMLFCRQSARSISFYSIKASITSFTISWGHALQPSGRAGNRFAVWAPNAKSVAWSEISTIGTGGSIPCAAWGRPASGSYLFRDRLQ